VLFVGTGEDGAEVVPAPVGALFVVVEPVVAEPVVAEPDGEPAGIGGWSSSMCDPPPDPLGGDGVSSP
jgi:hypothetical protein